MLCHLTDSSARLSPCRPVTASLTGIPPPFSCSPSPPPPAATPLVSVSMNLLVWFGLVWLVGFFIFYTCLSLTYLTEHNAHRSTRVVVHGKISFLFIAVQSRCGPAAQRLCPFAGGPGRPGLRPALPPRGLRQAPRFSGPQRGIWKGRSLAGTTFANIFSLSVACLLPLWSVSCTEQKFQFDKVQHVTYLLRGSSFRSCIYTSRPHPRSSRFPSFVIV